MSDALRYLATVFLWLSIVIILTLCGWGWSKQQPNYYDEPHYHCWHPEWSFGLPCRSIAAGNYKDV